MPQFMNSTALFLAFLSIPLSILFCVLWPKFMNLYFSILVLSTTIFRYVFICFFNDGYVFRSSQGLEIHIADICAIILFFSMKFHGVKFDKCIPLTIPYILFILAATISWIINLGQPNIDAPEGNSFKPWLYPLFEIIKFCKCYFIMFVAAQFFRNRDSVTVLLTTLAGLIIFHTLYALEAHYIEHQVRIGNNLTEPNSLAGYIGMIGVFFLPFIYQKNTKHPYGFVLLLLSGLVIVILTLGRAILFTYGMLIIFGSIWCVLYFPTIKNIRIVLIGIICSSLLFSKAASTIYDRYFTTSTFESGFLVREPAYNLALSLPKQHPFGVGLGNFALYNYVINADFGRCHNMWYTIFAETGYLGLAMYIIFWARYLQMNIFCFFRNKVRQDSLIVCCTMAIFFSLSIFHVQNLFHFFYQLSGAEYLMHVFLGLLCRIYIDSKSSSSTVRSIFSQSKN